MCWRLFDIVMLVHRYEKIYFTKRQTNERRLTQDPLTAMGGYARPV
jgi:hypothetical protein